jgi:hypothetical protein
MAQAVVLAYLLVSMPTSHAGNCLPTKIPVFPVSADLSILFSISNGSSSSAQAQAQLVWNHNEIYKSSVNCYVAWNYGQHGVKLLDCSCMSARN